MNLTFSLPLPLRHWVQMKLCISRMEELRSWAELSEASLGLGRQYWSLEPAKKKRPGNTHRLLHGILKGLSPKSKGESGIDWAYWVYMKQYGICMCGVCSHVCVAHMALRACGDQRVFCICSITLPPFLLRQGLSRNLELGWQPANHSNPPVSTFSSTGVISTLATVSSFLHRSWGLNSGPHACVDNILPCWVISQPLGQDFTKPKTQHYICSTLAGLQVIWSWSKCMAKHKSKSFLEENIF